MKIFLRIVTGFFATILSFILIVLLVAAGFVSSFTSVATPTGITSIVQNIDLASMLATNEEVAQAFEDMGIPAEGADKILKSNAVKELLNLYMTDFNAALSGEPIDSPAFNEENFKQVINNNIDEIATIISEIAPEDAQEIPIEEIKQDIIKAVDEQAPEIIKMLPSSEDIAKLINGEGLNLDGMFDDLAPDGDFDTEDLVSSKEADANVIIVTQDSYNTAAAIGAPNSAGDADGTVGAGDGAPSSFEGLGAITSLLNNSITYTLIIISLVVAALIFVLRLKNFGGMLWIAVDCIIAGCIITFTSLGLNAVPDLIGSFAEIDATIGAIIAPVVTVVAGSLLTFGLVLFAIAVLLIVGFIVIKIVRKKIAAAKEAAALTSEAPATDSAIGYSADEVSADTTEDAEAVEDTDIAEAESTDAL